MPIVDPLPTHGLTRAVAVAGRRHDIPRAQRALADLRNAQADLSAAAGGPREHLRQALERARPVVAACGDALAQAEFALIEARMQAPHDGLARVIGDLRFALRVFRANRRDTDEAAGWCALAAWLTQAGQRAAAMHCMQQALSIERLPQDLRLALMDPLLPGLAEESGIDAAWQAYGRQFAPYVAAAPPGPALARARLALSNLHVIEAIERAGLRSRTNLHHGQGSHRLGPMTAAVAGALANARRQLEAALALRHPLVTRHCATVEAGIFALEGRVDEALQGFGHAPLTGIAEGFRLEYRGWTLRISGRWREALDQLVPALALARDHGARSLELAALIECAICYDETGDSTAASRAWAESLRLLACAHASPAGSLPALDIVDDTAQPPLNMVRLRRAEPPCVARALRLMRQHLAQRLTLADLARDAEVSPRTLQAAFRDYRGATVVASYRQLALQQARDRLTLTARPIKEIAADCGYRSTATFTRDFSATYGLPPAAFRRHAAGRASEAG